jgi:hypothetical protein
VLWKLSFLLFVQNLPCEAKYLPAITIQLKTSSGKAPIGICVVKNLHEYRKNEEDQHLLAQMFDPNEKDNGVNMTGKNLTTCQQLRQACRNLVNKL